MIIKNIEIKNWGRYPSIDIPVDVNNDRNVVLIRARNNNGKTTLFYALKWVLYGDDGLLSHQRQTESIEWINRQAAADGDGEMYVELTLDINELKSQLRNRDIDMRAMKDDFNNKLKKQNDDIHSLDVDLVDADNTNQAMSNKLQKADSTIDAMRGEIEGLKRTLERQRNFNVDEREKIIGDMNIEKNNLLQINQELSGKCHELENILRDRDLEIHNFRIEIDRLRV